MRPGVLAVRTANEYRRRDVVSYLALRFMFHAESAKRDRWATEIASDLTLTRTNLPYRHSRVYRGVTERGLIDYRDLYFPGPAEMLAEASLLQECMRAGGAFERGACVYSNVLADFDSRHGMIDPYFRWWKTRQSDIARTASTIPDGLVLFFDIKTFYSAVSQGLAVDSWRVAVQKSELPRRAAALGEKLLSDYARVASKSGALLMGPMFAHMMGNLVLRAFDAAMTAAAPGAYFRYVDDIAIVVPDIHHNMKKIVQQNLPNGLILNESKTLQMNAGEWARRTQSFASESGARYWVRLVSALQYFLVTHSDKSSRLLALFRDEGIRLPVRDYAHSARTRGYLERLRMRLMQPWFDRALAPSTPEDVLKTAQEARREILFRFLRAAQRGIAGEGMERKFDVRFLRYAAGRLLYLASPSELGTVEKSIENVLELTDLHAIYRALRTNDVSALLPFSGAVAQAAAQLLASVGQPVQCEHVSWPSELQFAWAVLRIFGVDFRAGASAPPSESPIVRLATGEPLSRGVFTDFDDYYREVFSLRRNPTVPPDALLLDAFDTDEPPVFDALDLLRMSS